MANPHTKLWDAVAITDPRYAKAYQGTGGFRGTSVAAEYRYMRATEQFGPCGIGWGWTVAEDKIIDCCWYTRIVFWYLLEGVRGEITQWGGTSIAKTRKGKDDEGPVAYVDEDGPKKSITDAVTKCLSILGFDADIHLGKWEKPEYKEWLESHFRKKEEDRAAAKSATRDAAPSASTDLAPVASVPVSTAPAAAPATRHAPAPGLTPKQQCNAWYARLKTIDPVSADTIHGRTDLVDTERRDAMGKSLANALWVKLAGDERRSAIRSAHADDWPALIQGLSELVANPLPVAQGSPS